MLTALNRGKLILTKLQLSYSKHTSKILELLIFSYIILILIYLTLIVPSCTYSSIEPATGFRDRFNA